MPINKGLQAVAISKNIATIATNVFICKTIQEQTEKFLHIENHLVFIIETLGFS